MTTNPPSRPSPQTLELVRAFMDVNRRDITIRDIKPELLSMSADQLEELLFITHEAQRKAEISFAIVVEDLAAAQGISPEQKLVNLAAERVRSNTRRLDRA